MAPTNLNSIMNSGSILPSLFRYQAWANDAFLQTLEGSETARHPKEHHTALRLLNHCYVVNQIFKAHLTGTGHSFTADNTPETPTPQTLRAAMAALDGWFLEYVLAATAEQLAEPVEFTFTDGDKGCMTREEMLVHVATHGGYHRGEVGRILKQIAAALPWETFAVHLHQVDPARRFRV